MLAQPHAVAAGGLLPGAVTIAFSGCMSARKYFLSCPKQSVYQADLGMSRTLSAIMLHQARWTNELLLSSL